MVKIVQISTAVFPVIQDTPVGQSMQVMARTACVDENGKAWILKPASQFSTKDTWVALPEIPEEESTIGGVN